MLKETLNEINILVKRIKKDMGRMNENIKYK